MSKQGVEPILRNVCSGSRVFEQELDVSSSTYRTISLEVVLDRVLVVVESIRVRVLWICSEVDPAVFALV